MFFINNPRKKWGVFTICLIISAVVKKNSLESLSFHPEIMKTISKCSHNNAVFKATSIFLYHVQEFFNNSLINTFLFVLV